MRSESERSPLTPRPRAPSLSGRKSISIEFRKPAAIELFSTTSGRNARPHRRTGCHR
jgi:hypothetical protein